MRTLLVLICLAPQEQTAEAKKLLDGLAPQVKDSPFSQLEWEVGPTPAKGVGYFKRQQAWRTDNTFPNGVHITVWDGKGLLQHMKFSQNRVFRDKREPPEMLMMFGGGLAEIYYSGNADRLLKDALKVTVRKEKLDKVECSHVTIARKERDKDVESHYWIDADNNCKRYTRNAKVQGQDFETSYTYKVVNPPSTKEELFAYQPPPDAKDK
jgi:hypothetical protein